jgi:hypothetical protein
MKIHKNLNYNTFPHLLIKLKDTQVKTLLLFML